MLASSGDGLTSSSVADKIAGRALYVRDMFGSGVAAAGIVRSPYPHARIVSIDASKALAMPGVLGVLTGDDFEGLLLGSEIADEPVLTRERAHYVGDHVAAVVAEDEDTLRRALEAIEVTYDLLPAAFTPEEALTLGVAIHDTCPDNVAHGFSISHGDWDAAAAGVAVWAEGEYEIAPVQHAYMEPHAALVRYQPDCITLYAPVHAPYRVREEYESWVERWEERFEIKTPTIGGAFGAKYEHPMHMICAEFAHRLRRDVGMVFSRREDFLAARPRVDMKLRVRIGAARDGRLLAKEAEIIANNGAYTLHGPSVLLAVAMRMDNLYRFSAVRASARLVYTNTCPTECFRGFGDPEAAFAQEQLVDEIARRLGIDAVEIRRRNAVAEGDVTIHGWKISSSGFAPCLAAIEEKLHEARSGSEDDDEAGRFRFGYGLSSGMHVISNRGRSASDFARARLAVGSDGQLSLYCAEVDVGCGTPRVLAILAAPVLGIPPESIRVVLGDTEFCPYGLGSFASRTVFFAGNATLDAAHQLKRRLEDLRGEFQLRGASMKEVAAAADARGRLDELDITAEYEPEDVEVPDDSGHGNRSPAYTFAVHACKVAVDTWTGRVTVEKYWAAHDTGTVLNPPGARGQVYGGVLQGLGHALSERMVRSGDGLMVNPSFLDYRIPTALDSTDIEVIFTDTFDPGGPLGAKSIAEPPIIPVAACVANAIRDAIGVRVDRMPMDPETVYQAIQGAFSTQHVDSAD